MIKFIARRTQDSCYLLGKGAVGGSLLEHTQCTHTHAHADAHTYVHAHTQSRTHTLTHMKTTHTHTIKT